MADPAFLPVIKQAFKEASPLDGCEFDFAIVPQVVAALRIDNCVVRYVSGNECIDLKTLFAKLHQNLDIQSIELRGRGREGEALQIVAYFRIDGHMHNLSYVLE